MKVLLLNPPDVYGEKFTREGRCTQQSGIWSTLWPPLSLVYIATLLQENGHEVRVTDAPAENISLHGLKSLIDSFNPDVAILSTGTPTITNDLAVAALIKEQKPVITTIVIGTHVTVFDTQSLKQAAGLDIVIRNEPEITAVETVNNLHNLHNVLGITFRAVNGDIVRNDDREFASNLDALPFPNWSLINTASYTLPLKATPFLMVMPQRGCHFPCTFCTSQTYYGKKIRLRTVDSIVEEIKADIEKYGVREYFFWAETFTANPAFVKELCMGLITKNVNISWVCNSRIDTVNEELLQLMKRAGCWMISFGIESVDAGVLRGVRKNIGFEQIKKTLSAARKAGILTSGHIIFGLPNETVSSALETKRKVLDLDLNFAQFYCAVPFPGSELYNTALLNGWIKDNGNFSAYRQERAVMSLEGISPQDVEKIRTQAVREFYLRFTVISGIIKLMNPRSLFKTIVSTLKFLKVVE
ncbi:MAG: radical SAM protein [Nitrospirae bacterium]|nr:radical SAM protein [Nitrospirota bacterium]